jgi:hypothetical protein
MHVCRSMYVSLLSRVSTARGSGAQSIHGFRNFICLAPVALWPLTNREIKYRFQSVFMFAFYILWTFYRCAFFESLLPATKYFEILHLYIRRDSVVGIASDYGLDDQGVRVRVPVGPRMFSKSSRPALGSTQPPIQWVPGVFSSGVKRPGCEADHSLPASAEVKKMWIYTSTTSYAFMA